MVGRTNVGGGSGSYSSAWAYIGVTYPVGSVCTATNNTITFTAADTTGQYVFEIPQPSGASESWTVSCTNGTSNKSRTVTIDTQYQFEVIAISYTRLPSGYTEVEYLEQSTGVEYVRFPDINASFNGSLEFAWQPTAYASSDTYSIMGAVYTNPSGGVAAFTASNKQVYKWVDNVYESQVADSSIRRVVINQTSTRYIIENDVVLGTCSGTTSGRTYFGATYVYGSGNYYSTSPIRLFEFKQADSNGDLTLDAVPCRTSANLIGFYDMITGTFYQNANSSGSFVAGADV